MDCSEDLERLAIELFYLAADNEGQVIANAVRCLARLLLDLARERRARFIGRG